MSEIQSGDMSVADQVAEEEADLDVGGGLDRSVFKGRIREMDDDEMMADSDYEEELEKQLDEDYERYKERRAERDPKFRAKQSRKEHDEWHGFDGKKKTFDDDSDSDSDDQSDQDQGDDQSDSDLDLDRMNASDDDDDDDVPTFSKKKSNSLLNDLGQKKSMSKKTSSGLTTAASMFFDSDVFQGMDLDEEEEDDDQEEEEKEVDLVDEAMQSAIGSRKRKAEDEAPEESESEDESDFEIVKDDEFSAPSDDEEWDGTEDANSKAVKKARGK